MTESRNGTLRLQGMGLCNLTSGEALMNDTDVFAWWLKAFAYAAFSSLGGALGHLMRSIDKKERITWGRCIVESVAAGFVGLLVLLMCEAMGVGAQWTGVIVGVSGWLGASATIRMLEVAMRKRLGLEQQQNGDVPPQPPSGI